MTDKIDLFLDDLKCAIERFEPKEGDLFVLTVPSVVSPELEERIRDQWNKNMKNPIRVVVCAAGVNLKLAEKSECEF